MIIQKPKGTKDLLPEETYQWQEVENKIKKVLESYCYKEIRVPVFEHTELFQRGVGETTDVVQKEMYTFDDKGGRSITLRPEGTAGVVRAYLENGMASKPSPVKLWYNMAMYRYENVQKGRFREFHQTGAELIGTSSYLADVEIILMAIQIFKKLAIPNITLTINSIGCPTCRAKYQEVLREFFSQNIGQYCETCKTRFEKNPMRILDIGAPRMIDYLCEECKEHFENVKNTLTALDVDYEIDTNIVRGLDYYTKTVFEFIDNTSGLTVLGGGRYDGLVEEFGGQPTPAIGFAIGMERLIEMYCENHKNLIESIPDIYILSMEHESIEAIRLAEILRKEGIIVEKDILQRSFKAQMRYADKIKAKFLLVIGETEIRNHKAKIKNMQTGDEIEVSLEKDEIIQNICH